MLQGGRVGGGRWRGRPNECIGDGGGEENSTRLLWSVHLQPEQSAGLPVLCVCVWTGCCSASLPLMHRACPCPCPCAFRAHCFRRYLGNALPTHPSSLCSPAAERSQGSAKWSRLLKRLFIQKKRRRRKKRDHCSGSY